MMAAHKTDLGEQLYQLLPSVFRERDNTRRDGDNNIVEKGDLAKYLQANGDLLTQIYYTVKQQLYDNFPDEAGLDNEGLEQSCQPWLLPYFADLLDVTLVSPDIAGQRSEVANAIAWRQSKGSLPCLEDICEAVGQFEVEIQEGYKRIATTARIGDPLLPAILFGADQALDSQLPGAEKARHPGLPYVTVDFRYASRSALCDANDPAAITSNIDNSQVNWCQQNHNGVPCFPGSYQDVSKRTVDFRTPGPGASAAFISASGTTLDTYQTARANKGFFHPRKLLCYTPLQPGFFSKNPVSIHWSSIENEENYQDDNIHITTGTIEWNDKQVPHYRFLALTDKPLKLRGVKSFDEEAVYEFENIWLENTLTIKDGQLKLTGCAVRKLIASDPEKDVPVLDAKSSLIKTIEVASGMIQLEYCTVLEVILAEVVLISDCILLKRIRKDRVDMDPPEKGCIRFSRFEPQAFNVGLDPQDEQLLVNLGSCTSDNPNFINLTFGEPGCGVLWANSSESIKYGAEDGGEMGAYHDDLMILKQDAVIDKLADFLPVGFEAVLVSDVSLNCAPPQKQS
ncbi:hypothetical protein [Thalassomonas sp. RHCl1]|uniref:hypothetical protein n=1 Tax=Thalassomonas sp. RHCl1 TaxID=2995320 RepID=UPI00248B67FC|nr:hypothetical protein [Thalassomonas sp. RHCl1]